MKTFIQKNEQDQGLQTGPCPVLILVQNSLRVSQFMYFTVQNYDEPVYIVLINVKTDMICIVNVLFTNPVYSYSLATLISQQVC